MTIISQSPLRPQLTALRCDLIHGHTMHGALGCAHGQTEINVLISLHWRERLNECRLAKWDRVLEKGLWIRDQVQGDRKRSSPEILIFLMTLLVQLLIETLTEMGLPW